VIFPNGGIGPVSLPISSAQACSAIPSSVRRYGSVFWSELMAALTVSFLLIMVPSLRSLISHVVGLRANEQMLGVETPRIVAAMKDASRVIKRKTQPQMGSKSMGGYIVSLIPSFPIPVGVFRSAPVPAARLLIELEAVNQGNATGRHKSPKVDFGMPRIVGQIIPVTLKLRQAHRSGRNGY
jgi:hypothetical protein